MIERCRDAFPVIMMCHLLKVSGSGHYEWRTPHPSNRAQDNSRLLRRIHALHAESNGVFGSPRMYDELRYQGETCSLNRVARLMKSARLAGIPARIQWRRKPSGIRPAPVGNHLQRDFTAQQGNTKWLTDITYIRTAEGWLYLMEQLAIPLGWQKTPTKWLVMAVVIDLYSGLVIGWSMSQCMERQLVVQAVLMALWQKQSASEVILHSDRGSQYTSHEYQLFLSTHGIVSSMSAVGSCYDNAAAESFFGVLKRERVNRKHYMTRSEARSDIFDYIERFHNQRKQRQLGSGNIHQPALN
jgi:putative transposase